MTVRTLIQVGEKYYEVPSSDPAYPHVEKSRGSSSDARVYANSSLICFGGALGAFLSNPCGPLSCFCCLLSFGSFGFATDYQKTAEVGMKVLQNSLKSLKETRPEAGDTIVPYPTLTAPSSDKESCEIVIVNQG